MIELGKYDENHSIFISLNKPFDFKIKKNGSWISHDSKMILEFQKQYDLSQDFIRKASTVDEVKERIQKIQNNYYCDKNQLKLVGLKHLKECRDNPKLEYPSYFKELESEFDTLLNKLDEKLNNNQDDFVLPILEITKKLFQKKYFFEHVKDTLKNTLVVLSQQGFMTVEHLVEGLLDLGIPAQNLILMTKPHTTCEDNLKVFKDLEIKKGIKYETTADEYLKNKATNKNYKEYKIKAVTQTINTMEKKITSKDIKNLIIHDEGGELIDNIDFGNEQLKKVNLSTSEHTTCGIEIRQRNKALNQIPCFNMAGSALKANLEAYFIAEASFEKITSLLDEKKGQKKIKVAVVGAGGNIGHHFLKMLHDKYNKQIEIIVCEKDEEKYKKLIKETPLGSLKRMNTESAFNHADIIFGCTGVDITENMEIGNIPKRDLTLVSLSSGTREFRKLSESIANQNEYKHIKLHNDGKPVIFDGDKHGIHPLKIQLVRALTMTSIMMQLMYLSISPKLKESSQKINHQIYDDFHQKEKILKVIDGNIQSFIFKMYQKMIDRLQHRGNIKVSPTMQCLSTTKNQIQLDKKELILKMKHEAIEEFNCFAQVDQNHQIHLLQEHGIFQIYLSKYNEKIYDFNMIKKVLADVGINILNFYQMPDSFKLELLTEKFKKFQMSVFFLDNPCGDVEYCSKVL